MKRMWIVMLALAGGAAQAAELGVGPGQQFARLEDAVAAAKPGDVIAVHPAEAPAGSPKTALLVRTPNLTIRAITEKGQPVKLAGDGFDYSGDGRIPRAIIQFDEAAKGCVLEGFELSGAHNKSFNGAGVRINSASDITIRHCEIHDNDMGMMSNGKLEAHAGANQLIDACRIYHNGNQKEPGQNHNLYMGGASVTIRGCEIFSSLTGMNIKSRAHVTRIEGCYVHDAAAREIDLVDDKGNTDVPGSDAFVIGNILVKGALSDANHTVIQFGQDIKQGHTGTIWVVNNTVVTRYISPVLQLSAANVGAVVANNIIWDEASGQRNQVLIGLSNGADMKNVKGSHNWLSLGFGAPGLAMLNETTTWVGAKGESPPFADPRKGHYHLTKSLTGKGAPWKDMEGIGAVLQFVPPAGSQKRSDTASPTLGALEARP